MGKSWRKFSWQRLWLRFSCAELLECLGKFKKEKEKKGNKMHQKLIIKTYENHYGKLCCKSLVNLYCILPPEKAKESFGMV